MPREGGVTTVPSPPRHPGQASNASADPGSIRHDHHYLASWSTAFAQQFKRMVDGVDGPLRHQLCQNEVVEISNKGAVRGADYPHWNGYVEVYFSAAWGGCGGTAGVAQTA